MSEIRLYAAAKVFLTAHRTSTPSRWLAASRPTKLWQIGLGPRGKSSLLDSRSDSLSAPVNFPQDKQGLPKRGVADQDVVWQRASAYLPSMVNEQAANVEHFDVLIIGAGLSGIGAACHLVMRCPGKSFALLEARGTIGGTWDLFRYPGIRSDSDMYTLGYSFHPWTDAKAIADGPSILRYVRETAEAYGVDSKIRFNHRVTRIAWSTENAEWSVEAEQGAERTPVRFTCGFLYTCSGYYDYAGGYTPEFPGVADYRGRLVHPQEWPDDLEYADKQVVVIGSGATAVTLVPAMAKDAAHVTMLQRSPTYIVSRPAEDAFANLLRRKLPSKLAYWVTRWRNVLLTMFFYNLARRKPDKFKRGVLAGVRAELGPDYDVATHFTPSYNPWDQRLCLVPDSDLFRALRSGNASVVTDTIDRFTQNGLKLSSGRELEAEVVITATGLKMILLGGIEVTVDGVSRGPIPQYKLQGNDVQRCSQSRRGIWIHECIVDAEGRPHQRIRLPHFALYGPASLGLLFTEAGGRTGGGAVSRLLVRLCSARA